MKLLMVILNIDEFGDAYIKGYAFKFNPIRNMSTWYRQETAGTFYPLQSLKLDYHVIVETTQNIHVDK